MSVLFYVLKFPSICTVHEKYSILRRENLEKTQFFLSFTKVNKKNEITNKSKDFLDLLSLRMWIFNSKVGRLFCILNL